MIRTGPDPEEIHEVHPRARGVSGMPHWKPPPPEELLHKWQSRVDKGECYECGRSAPKSMWRKVCKRCNNYKRDHDADQRRARKEIERRKGKVAVECATCHGTGYYHDEQGYDPFYGCTACKGTGERWRKPKKAKTRAS